jgi:uncharacterized repeat protein (TIGR03803 family)
MKQKFPENAFLSLCKTTFGSAWRRWFSLPFWTAVFSALALQARAGVVVTTLHSFGTFENGTDLENALVQGTDGYFYGTAGNGGLHGYGTVFKISTNGTLTSLYSFTGGNDGSFPGALVQGGDGNFYGTTTEGGANGDGTVFSLTTNGLLTTLYSFTGYDGTYPQAGLALGSDGNFYGTTAFGGQGRAGTVFRISVPLQVTTTALPMGTNGWAYGHALTASGGQIPYSWTNSSGALPPGLTLATG